MRATLTVSCCLDTVSIPVIRRMLSESVGFFYEHLPICKDFFKYLINDCKRLLKYMYLNCYSENAEVCHYGHVSWKIKFLCHQTAGGLSWVVTNLTFVLGGGQLSISPVCRYVINLSKNNCANDHTGWGTVLYYAGTSPSKAGDTEGSSEEGMTNLPKEVVQIVSSPLISENGRKFSVWFHKSSTW